MARRTPGAGRVQALALLALAAPVLVLVAALGTRVGAWPVEIGYDLLTLGAGWFLAFVGAAAALGALVLSFGNFRKLGLPAIAAVLVAGATLGGFIWQKARLAAGPVENVSTDLTEVPGFGDLGEERGGQGPGPAVGAEACPGALPVMRQIAPTAAIYALEQAGFTLRGAGVARADGSQEGFWFGFDHDAVIRIRPGRTDIRVAARDHRPHGGEACRMATAISETLRSAG
ncbi:hypothetical protein GCM10007859_09600 [Brevundimonas denitrificans]|uniref:DUF1499 domain-containing protein n=1 Tax=Brevundimonas denitrificans TaxID=1443434 RepID=A0ABQ6BIQ0_9CAUL|nr:DUF1499 domain-containing protein [Brevundimonas denitrificans]GLS00950.1 hypothetical protein GCM10007859_09600 [Brevundimonas denitrificans]